MKPTIQGLWIGEALSTLEQLSITSFLAHGHRFDLYVYSPVRRVPRGVRLRNAAEILPRNRIFQYRDQASYAGFANYFRYKLLLDRGGWWVDLDAVCLQPFDCDDEFVFSSERTRDGRQVPNAGFIKAPPASALLAELWRACDAMDPAKITWGETGSRLLARTLPRFGLERCVRDSQVFCPLDFPDWRTVFDPDATWKFSASTLAIHLWHEMWRAHGQDKDATYDSHCLYERLKALYGVAPAPET